MARADAVLKLMAIVKALSLTTEATVGDFLAESPSLPRALAAQLLEKATPLPVAEDKPTRQADLRITPVELVTILRKVRKHHYHGQRFRHTALDRLSQQTDPEALRVTGAGNAALFPAGDDFVPWQFGVGCFPGAGEATQEFWLGHVTDLDRAAAERIARGGAMQRLAEEVGRLRIGQTPLPEFVAKYDAEMKDLQSFLQAARVQAIHYHVDAPVLETNAHVSLRAVYASVKTWLHSRGVADSDVRLLEPLIVAAGKKKLSAIGVAAVPADKLKKLSPELAASVRAASSASAWAGRTLSQVGVYVVRGDDRAAAVRDAELDARRALLRRMEKLPVLDGEYIADLAKEDREVRRALLAALLTAETAGEPSLGEDGSLEVTMRLRLHPLWRVVFRRQREQMVALRKHPVSTQPGPRSPSAAP